MSTHGYIKIKRGKDDCRVISSESVIHVTHDGYLKNMVPDLFNIPKYVFEFLKSNYESGERNYYILNNIMKYNKDKKFEQLLDDWKSMIPIGSIEYTFESFVIAQDPLQYAMERENIHSANITVEFAKSKRLPGCIITINDADEEDELDMYMEEANKDIYLEENKIKRIPDETKNTYKYHMNVNHIVIDMIWQEMDLSVSRDKKLNTIL